VRKDDVDLAALRCLLEKVMPPPGSWRIQRTEEGASTQVYRVSRDSEVLYLRVAEEREASLAPEVRVHELLRARGALVPVVVHYEPFYEPIERSIMITTAIPGEPVCRRPVDAEMAEIVEAAGRDLATINSVSVQGFGWIRRDKPSAELLEAMQTSNRQFMLEEFDAHLALLSARTLQQSEVAAIRRLVYSRDRWLNLDQAWLAHGDFDLSHIFQLKGRYTGIIDFGEIRGADRLYDLGHFSVHDGEKATRPLLPSLIAGYAEKADLPPDYLQHANFMSVLIGMRALARSLQRSAPNDYQRHLVGAIRRALAAVA
jgi:aminoglycoside phosphotransferase (APT) family kinase protein